MKTPALIAALIMALSAQVFATDYYVSTTGDDTNAGSEAQPFKTILKACSLAAAGSTIYVKAGVYGERITFANSGTSSAFLTLRNFADDAVAIDGTSVPLSDGVGALISIDTQSYIRIQGLELRNFSTAQLNTVAAGIMVRGDGSGIEIRKCHVHHIANTAPIPDGGLGRDAFGIICYGTSGTNPLSGIVIDSCEVDHCTLGSSESLSLNGNVDGFTVTNNSVHDNDNIGIVAIGWEKTAPSNDQARNGVIRGNTVYAIHSKGNPAYGNDSSAGGIYVDGGRDIVVERNEVRETDYGIEIGCEHKGKTCSGVTVRDNVVHDCLVSGLGFGGYDLKRGITLNCRFTNNTFYNDDTSGSGAGEIMIQVSKNNVFMNNVVAASAQGVLVTNFFAKSKSMNNVFDYNVYFSSGGGSFQWQKRDYANFAKFQTGSKQDAHSKFIDPAFISIDPKALNLRLAAGSPAIDAGDPAFTPGADETDFDGQPRVKGAAVDVGAFER